MKNYGKVQSSARPQEVEITATQVFVAKNIQPFEKVIDEDHTISGFEYDYIAYTKDEYLIATTKALSDLEEELEATKILLGVE